ncbi:hypothetical protein AAHA92_06504 [Salvia divinorum]|uniref:DEK-C domain-containing protein n=1 Tax=Salvia divinorum TaxID=28513 RepID=A0ABD1I859_SALDI
MISDSELIERLRDVISKSDPNTTTNAILRRRLEEELGIDLSDRKTFIREQVDIYMQGQFENEDANDDGIGDEGSPEAAEEEEEEEEIEESSNSGTVKKVAKKRLVFQLVSSGFLFCLIGN